jgi:hypothetical protein
LLLGGNWTPPFGRKLNKCRKEKRGKDFLEKKYRKKLKQTSKKIYTRGGNKGKTGVPVWE